MFVLYYSRNSRIKPQPAPTCRYVDTNSVCLNQYIFSESAVESLAVNRNQQTEDCLVVSVLKLSDVLSPAPTSRCFTSCCLRLPIAPSLHLCHIVIIAIKPTRTCGRWACTRTRTFLGAWRFYMASFMTLRLQTKKD